MIRPAAVLLLLLAGCGDSTSSGSASGDPPGYGAWKYRNFILGQTFSGGGQFDGVVEIDGSRDGGTGADWIEVALNGTVLGRKTTGGGETGVSYDLRLRPGANWIRFFSSASRIGWEFQIDTRQGTRFTFTPKDKIEWTMVQSGND